MNIAYGQTRLNFGKEYIIPKPFDPRLIAKVPPAVAKAAMESGIATEPITDWDKYENDLLERMGNDNKLVRLLLDRAKSNPKRLVFAEGDHLSVLKAAQTVKEEGIAIPILLGRKDVILELMGEIDFDPTGVEIIDPKADEESEQKNKYAKKYWEDNKRKGITLYDAERLLRERNYFAAMMVKEGDADALLSGYSRSYPTVVKPMIDLIGLKKGATRMATMNVMMTDRGPLFISDTSINIDPTAKDLAKIAQMTADAIEMFGIKPVMAMVSYANFGSSEHPNATKVGEAVEYLHRYYPNLIVDGEIQMNFALNSDLRKEKFPFSKLNGKKVNALIFPNLDSANSNYKLLSGLNKAESIGPIMMGMAKPVHILQLGASVDEIINMAAVAVIDAQEKEKQEREISLMLEEVQM